MKKYTYLFATLLVCLPVACNKVNEQEEKTQIPTITYIKAEGNEEATKASIANDEYGTFTWNTYDRIAVWAGGYKISDPLASTYNATNSATFSFSGDNVVIENNRDNFAIFPAKLVWDGSAIRSGSASSYTSSSLKLTLPDTYTLEEVQGEVSPTPMIATNAKDGTLAFKHLCPLLRITVVNIPKQTKRIEFNFNDVNVQGEFTLSSVDPATTAITTEDGGTGDIITVTMEGNTAWRDQLVVNLPVPTGTYGNITITAYDAVSGGHSVLKLTKPIKAAGWSPSSRLASRKMTATLPVFSVGGDKYITFAPGNLQYQASTNTWRFAANQWDIIGDNAGNTTAEGSRATQSDWIDLFGWGTSGWNNSGSGYGAYYHPYDSAWGEGSAETAALYGPTGTLDLTGLFANGDWGMHAIGDYPAGTWRTPTGHVLDAEGERGDWGYILYVRDNISTPTQSGEARVNGVVGKILLPDDFVDPKTNTKNSGNFRAGLAFDSKKHNVYLEDGWKAMEEAGAVFFPYAGQRKGTTVDSVGSYCYYWTASAGIEKPEKDGDPAVPAESNASRMLMRYSSNNVASTILRSTGFAVRLVRDLN